MMRTLCFVVALASPAFVWKEYGCELADKPSKTSLRAAGGPCEGPRPCKAMQQMKNGLKTVGAAELAAVLEDDGPTVVSFYEEWCPESQAALLVPSAPIAQVSEKRSGLQFVKVNMEQTAVPDLFGTVRHIPAIFLVRGSQVARYRSDDISVSDFESFLDAHKSMLGD
mmetsp:Transcript_39009/g.85112  ORF Transcript_39009/g.85112 Transcript_39009/m.85112 type:complete len:168 (+) Transcript_39009:54-557(+)